MDKVDNNNDNSKEDKKVEWETAIDREALDFIIKLYDGTFRDLVNR